MKDWVKITISILATLIFALISFSVKVSFDSVRRDIDRLECTVGELEDDHKADVVTIHQRISKECRP